MSNIVVIGGAGPIGSNRLARSDRGIKMNNARLGAVTDPCVNPAPGCVDHFRNSLWAVGATLVLLAILTVFLFVEAV